MLILNRNPHCLSFNDSIISDVALMHNTSPLNDFVLSFFFFNFLIEQFLLPPRFHFFEFNRLPWYLPNRAQFSHQRHHLLVINSFLHFLFYTLFLAPPFGAPSGPFTLPKVRLAVSDLRIPNVIIPLKVLEPPLVRKLFQL